jgi:hypothetical protein
MAHVVTFVNIDGRGGGTNGSSGFEMNTPANGVTVYGKRRDKPMGGTEQWMY